jgi:putative ABC transport system permease protein
MSSSANESPIGKRITVRKILSGLTGLGPPIAWEIVGIVGDEKATGLENEAGIGAYASLAQNPVVGLGIVAKTSTDPDSAIRSMAEALTKVDKTQVLVAPSTIEDWKSGSLRSRRWTMSLLGAFALLAMLLSAAGIYGVLSFVTARRTHEMGIPAALGATRGRIIGLVVWGGTRPVLVGVSLALAGANGLTRFIESMLATKSKRNSSES